MKSCEISEKTVVLLLSVAPPRTWCESVVDIGPLAKENCQSGLSRFLNYVKGNAYAMYSCLLSCTTQLTS